jgi:hypothetical protein
LRGRQETLAVVRRRPAQQPVALEEVTYWGKFESNDASVYRLNRLPHEYEPASIDIE